MVVGSACTPSDREASGRTPVGTTPPGRSEKVDDRRLRDPSPCAEAPGFTCWTLSVPLDHSGTIAGTLDLQVATADDEAAPGGVLLLLSGGPGQYGVGLLPRVLPSLAPFADTYRVVMLDQRGTGATALRCPEVQAATGSSDILTAPPSAIRECARSLGPERRFYATADTVEDLELLRQALRADRWVLNGVSYGTFTAARYAIAYPEHVHGLVLDSVVPHDGFDPFLRANLRDAARVLRDVCADRTACSADPAADVAWLVRRGVDRVRLLNAITADSIVDPTFSQIVDVPAVLHLARRGERGPLEAFLTGFEEGGAAPTEAFSAALHVATLCADLRFPWSATDPVGARRRALREAAAGIRAEAVWPFDRATAVHQGVIQSCLHWLPTPAPSVSEDTELPDVPVLLLNGDRDLSTPVAWAKEEAQVAPGGTLVIVEGAGHGVQIRAESDRGRTAVRRFLLGLVGS